MSHTEPQSLTVHAVDATPFGSLSDSLIARGDHALFGVSTGNSYFSRRRLTEALSWALVRFEAVDVVHADLYLDAMCEALGYGPEDARRSAAKQVRGVRRRIQGALEDIGGAATRVRARPLSAFVEQPAYQDVLGRARAALGTDTELRAVRDEMAHRFLSARLGPGVPPTGDQVRTAQAYIDAELPFFLDTPAILGVASSVHCYHSVLALGRLLFGDRATGLRPADTQGYAVVACQN
ncbi:MULTISPECIES: tRNA-dependent cyclodipeptide synthase [Streptomyces]|uniref:Cyclodipeptide synthase n=1 Tax=Streptomyces doudnae TaxID=3075536 RepID=A0ABD5EU09_9ACTN|nr:MULTISPECIES: tRNA-dependent cyclodipeptide synthase [unclassified Streptomyces]MDT0438206.1 tRNA-dependent cyclodipeptide synthase [Streptomyces sp. DSM 41981]MYQ64581.1 tRNA-dependent cyclodipeptide synthase [Streptomyces sp. SID4950]SCD81966.1 cyclo(L-tyrosyl-L-tyrosyl) synthase [Streptomyces sp. SolWspMP-5a-2]